MAEGKVREDRRDKDNAETQRALRFAEEDRKCRKYGGQALTRASIRAFANRKEKTATQDPGSKSEPWGTLRVSIIRDTNDDDLTDGLRINN